MSHSTHWSRRGLLKAGAGIGLLSALPSIARASGTSQRVLVVRALGGWDVTFCMDPRLTSDGGPDGPDATGSDEQVANYGGLPIMASSLRPSVDAFFERNAANTLVVNGISVGSIVHDECSHRMLTGSRSETAAEVAVLTAVENADSHTLPYLDLAGGGKVGPYAALTGSLGLNNQIIALLDRRLPIPTPDGTTMPRYTAEGPQKTAVEAYLDQRRARFATEMGARADLARFQAFEESVGRQRALIEERHLFLDNLNFGQSGTLSTQADIATILMSEGLCHSGSLRFPVSFDTHDDISQQHDLFESLFEGLDDLAEALRSSSLWDETIVVVVSEMTRTPKLNRDGGKDHWPTTSALIFGGGISGGRVLGGTSFETIDSLPVNLATGQVDEASGRTLDYQRFVAGLLHAAGTDPAEHLPNVEVLHGIVD